MGALAQCSTILTTIPKEHKGNVFITRTRNLAIKHLSALLENHLSFSTSSHCNIQNITSNLGTTPKISSSCFLGITLAGGEKNVENLDRLVIKIQSNRQFEVINLSPPPFGGNLNTVSTTWTLPVPTYRCF